MRLIDKKMKRVCKKDTKQRFNIIYLNNNKLPGPDNSNGEMLKYGGKLYNVLYLCETV